MYCVSHCSHRINTFTQPALSSSKLTIKTPEQDAEVNNNRTKLTIKTPKQRHFTPCSSVFIVNFELANADCLSLSYN